MSNLNSNLVSATMTSSQESTAKAAVKTLQSSLPRLIGLTPDERMMIPKVAWNNRPFIDEAMMHVEKSPEFLPAFLNSVEMNKDHAYYKQLTSILADLNKLTQMANDTQTLAGSELYIACLSYYRTVKEAALLGIPGAMPIYLALKRRFELDFSASTSGETDAPASDVPATDEPPTDSAAIK